MAVLVNRAKMSTSTTGTGTITLGSAEDGYQTFADAGVANSDVVRYIIEDGSNFEIGTGAYTSSGTTLSRTVSESSNSNNAINLSGSATVFVGATAQDLYDSSGKYPAKAWMSLNGTGSISIINDGNVSSVTDNATGQYTPTFSNSFSAATYSTSACGKNSQSLSISRPLVFIVKGFSDQTPATSSEMIVSGQTNSADEVDSPNVCCSWHLD